MRQVATTLLTLLLFLSGWQVAVIAFHIHPIILPPPTRVAAVAIEEHLTLTRALGNTALASLCGLGASIFFGSLIAVAFSQSQLLRRAFYPYVVFLQTVPIVAIAPLLITWSGYQWRTVVLVSIIISLFPIVSNVTAGQSARARRNLPTTKLDACKSLQSIATSSLTTTFKTDVQRPTS